MLRQTSNLRGYGVGAADGPIGSIQDFLFDDATWLVRWFVVDTGAFFPGRKVLLPPSALSHDDHTARQLNVKLTRQEVKDSPSIDTDLPVSREMETHLYDYYGWSPYWSTGFNVGGYGTLGGVYPPLGLGFVGGRGDVRDQSIPGDPHLRSAQEIEGYHIEARDGEVGHVWDVLLEDGDWSIRYLIVDTLNWWPGQKVLISPRSIQAVNWGTRTVDLDVDRATVKASPAYDGTQALDRAYEAAFHAHYGARPEAPPA
jgi:hypothetical protein